MVTKRRHSTNKIQMFFINFSSDIYTSKTALIQPSFSGWFVTWAYLPTKKRKTCSQKKDFACQTFSYLQLKFCNLLYDQLVLAFLRQVFKIIINIHEKKRHSPHTTLPPCVTKPSSLTFTLKWKKTKQKKECIAAIRNLWWLGT